MKKVILAITIGLFTVSSFAQKQQNRNEISIWGGGGISSLQYDLTFGKHKIGAGGLVGLGYDFFFTYNWSLGIGAEFSALSAKAQLPLFQDQYLTTIPDYMNRGGDILLRVGTESDKGLYERQRAYYINIPLMARYQFDLFKGHKFYAALGPKFGIPIEGIYRTTGMLTTVGQELIPGGGGNATRDPYQNMPDHGFTEQRIPIDGNGKFYTGNFGKDFEDFKNSDNEKIRMIKGKMNFIASAEAGIKWRFKENKHWHMYTGLFVDWGLNNIIDKKNVQDALNFFNYNENQRQVTYDMNPIFASKWGEIDEDGKLVEKNFTNRVNTLAFGAKVRVSGGWKLFDKKEKVKEEPEEKPYEGLTAAQMEDIMSRNTKALIDAQQKEFEDLKDFLTQKEPYFLGPIVGFDLGKYILLVSMTSDLDQKVEVMKKYPNIKIVLEGHTDDYGSDKLNDQLGLDRANAVKDYLVKRGVAANRMRVTTKGKKEPVIPNASEENRRYNRRVEVLLDK